MPKLFVTDRDGVEKRVEAPTGLTLMEAIRNNGFDEMMALCGGCCSCATCHVLVDPGFIELLPGIGEDEDALLDSSSHRRTNSRLSCQIELDDRLDGLKVALAPDESGRPNCTAPRDEQTV
jgi:2Fe-2S ferredoxin